MPVSELVQGADVRMPEPTVDVAEVETPNLDLMFPEPEGTFLDLPLPKARNRKARPSPAELIESDQAVPDST